MSTNESTASYLGKRLEQILRLKPHLGFEIVKLRSNVPNKNKKKIRVERFKSKLAERILSNNIQTTGESLIKEIANYVPTDSNRVFTVYFPFYSPKGFYNFDVLSNNKIALIHHSQEDKMRISIVYKQGLVKNYFQFEFMSQHSMSLKTVASQIIFDYSKVVFDPK